MKKLLYTVCAVSMIFFFTACPGTASQSGGGTVSSGKSGGGGTSNNPFTPPHTEKEIFVTADELSVARLSDDMGNPQPKASLALSRPDLYFKLQPEFPAITQDTLTTAEWQAVIQLNGKNIAYISSPVPAAKRAVFSCPQEDVTVEPAVYLTFKIDSKPHTVKLSGAQVQLTGKREFPLQKYINLADNTFSDTGGNGFTTLRLKEADDFNYHFNGLNYKNYAEYKTARQSGSADEEAQAFYRLWQPEDDPDQPTVRHSASWDIRGCETKNSKLLIKTLQRDNDGIYLKTGTKNKYGGFTDLYSGPAAKDSQEHGSHKLINGSVLTKPVHNKRYGYFEAKLRVPKLINGNWSAFWVYGPHYEYDIMEFGEATQPWFDQTTHWHNGWEKPKYRDSLHNRSQPSVGGYNSDGKNNFFTLGLYWDETRFVYFVNGKKTHEITRDKSNPLKAAYERFEKDKTEQKHSETDFTVSPQLRPEGGTGGQAISDDFMWAFFSNEVLYKGWMGDLGAGNEGAFPQQMEVEYYAYYTK